MNEDRSMGLLEIVSAKAEIQRTGLKKESRMYSSVKTNRRNNHL